MAMNAMGRKNPKTNRILKSKVLTFISRFGFIHLHSCSHVEHTRNLPVYTNLLTPNALQHFVITIVLCLWNLSLLSWTIADTTVLWVFSRMRKTKSLNATNLLILPTQRFPIKFQNISSHILPYLICKNSLMKCVLKAFSEFIFLTNFKINAHGSVRTYQILQKRLC